jgi:hypothetical protein
LFIQADASPGRLIRANADTALIPAAFFAKSRRDMHDRFSSAGAVNKIESGLFLVSIYMFLLLQGVRPV